MILQLQTITAIFLAGSVSLLWWGTLRAPWLFLAFSTLAMLGLARLLTTTWASARLAFSPIVFLERQSPVSVEQAMKSWASIESVILSAVVLVVGFVLLFWLRRGLAVA